MNDAPPPIEPDTKDWTWVLETVCPECGFDAAAFPREEVGAMLRANAEQWRVLLAGDIQQVTHIFVHECLGEVARLVSEAKPLSEELPDEFETATQVWRLAL